MDLRSVSIHDVDVAVGAALIILVAIRDEQDADGAGETGDGIEAVGGQKGIIRDEVGLEAAVGLNGDDLALAGGLVHSGEEDLGMFPMADLLGVDLELGGQGAVELDRAELGAGGRVVGLDGEIDDLAVAVGVTGAVVEALVVGDAGNTARSDRRNQT